MSTEREYLLKLEVKQSLNDRYILSELKRIVETFLPCNWEIQIKEMIRIEKDKK